MISSKVFVSPAGDGFADVELGADHDGEHHKQHDGVAVTEAIDVVVITFDASRHLREDRNDLLHGARLLQERNRKAVNSLASKRYDYNPSSLATADVWQEFLNFPTYRSFATDPDWSLINIGARKQVITWANVGPNPCRNVKLLGHNNTLILAWVSNYIHYKTWDEIANLFPHGAVVDVWEWISNLIPHFTGYVISYPRWD